ncbi:MAG TPA: exodeoxyribonuclease VII small subunit [Planctomycetota bacterium]|nr:exodeoxyribonuclease VII small subunit [Planctomycetota bacterium]
MSRAKEAPEKPGEESFDARLARLEAIVGELEGGELGLEGALERYRDGVGLLKACRAQLDGYRRQVEELSAEADGALAPFAGDPDAGAGR